MKYLFHLLLILSLSACAAPNAQQNNMLSAPPDEKINGGESTAEMDLLLDDFDDFDDFGGDGETGGEPSYSDPLEPMNRLFFSVNDTIYYWLLKPVSNVYSAAVPSDIRLSIGNFVHNLAAPVRLLNNLLQGKVQDSGIVLSRFLINSTLGVYGFGDPALLEFGLQPKHEDFGQTLGSWGVGQGIYLCWPIIGPSSVRDSFGFLVDVSSHPIGYYIDEVTVSAGYYAGSRVNLLSLNPDVYEDLKKYSLDPYVSMRQVYLDYRRNKVEDKVIVQKTDNEL